MTFNVNHPILFIIVGAIITLVLAQSFYFLFKALRRAKQLGIAKETVKKTISSSAIFTVAPAVAILVGIVALSKSLGLALPWLRLSVIGSLSYETIAAKNTLGTALGTTVTDPSVYISIAWVMTISIAAGLVLVPFLTKKIHKGVNSIGMKDKKWGETLNNAMFLGMISAFVGYVFCDVGLVIKGDLSGFIPVCVMLVSAVVMVICGVLSSKLKARWITDYALPLSLVTGMASAIPFTMLLGGN